MRILFNNRSKLPRSSTLIAAIALMFAITGGAVAATGGDARQDATQIANYVKQHPGARAPQERLDLEDLRVTPDLRVRQAPRARLVTRAPRAPRARLAPLVPAAS